MFHVFMGGLYAALVDSSRLGDGELGATSAGNNATTAIVWHKPPSQMWSSPSQMWIWSDA